MMSERAVHDAFPFGKQAPVDRQAADADAGRCEDRIPERRGRRHRSHFAEAAGLLVAIQKVDLDRRRLVDAKLSVVVEVALLDAPFVEGYAVEQSGGQSEQDAALDLRANDVRIDLDTAVDGRHDLLQRDLAREGHRDFDDQSGVGSEVLMQRHATPGPRLQRPVPAGGVGNLVQHGHRARISVEQRPPIGDRILSCRMRQLVQEALDDEDVVRRRRRRATSST